jgi:hypothetical protein
MICYSLFIHTKLDDTNYNTDYLNFDRENFEDCLCIIKNLFCYPSKVTRIRIVQWAFNENVDTFGVLLNSFKVTFTGNNFMNEPIFTLEKDRP